MIKEIVRNPHPSLRKKSEPVKDFSDPRVKSVIQDIEDTLKAREDALGLAAPQIGVNLRIFGLDINGKIMIFINPEITHLSKKNSVYQEGCLSVPNKIGRILRANKAIMKYYDTKGRRHKIKAKGIIAEAFQHEVDHLNGILYIDKAQEIKEIET